VTSSLERAGLLKLNDAEVAVVAGIVFGKELPVPEFARRVIPACGLRACLVTLGERGVFAAEAGGGQVYAPGYRVKVVDTVGSGDAFSAGFIHSWLAGGSLAEACDFGNRLGALVAATAGATARITTEEIERIGQSGERIADPAFEESDAN
ncbi:MAG: PfkB family carbohydrate kinase, partial [Candidatus Glassbacteria bacterium]